MKAFLSGLCRGIIIMALLLVLVGGVCYFGGLLEFVGFGPGTEEVEAPSVTVIESKTEESRDEEMSGTQEPLEESQPEEIAEEKVQLLFAGDLYLTEALQEKYRKNGIRAAASDELLELTRSADIFALNNEFPYGTTGEAMEDKEYTFRVNPELVSVPVELGVDLVTLANNHILDFGREPLTETLQTLDGAGIAHVGAGENLAQAKQWETIEVQGKKIAFLGASRVYPESSWSAGENHSGVFSTYDATQLVEQIRQAKESSDYVFVLVHWGIERNTEPEDYQCSLARQYIDAGADAVIGSHPHVLQGIEYYQGKPIFYSLGNFIFSNRDYESILVELTLSEEGEQVRLIPCVSRSNQMQLLTDTEEYYSGLQDLSFGIEIDSDGIVREKSG